MNNPPTTPDPTPPQNPPPTVSKELGSRFSRLVWSTLGIKDVAGDIEAEVATVKSKARVLWILIIFCGLALGAGWKLKGCSADSKVERAQYLASSNSVALTIAREYNTTLQSQYNNLQGELTGLKIEIGPLREVASRLFTNSPPSKQLEQLLDLVQSVTNSLIQLTSEQSFSLRINGESVTSNIKAGTSITPPHSFRIKKGEPIVIVAVNNSEFSVDRIKIDVLADFAETNMIAIGWNPQPGVDAKIAGFPRILTHWEHVAMTPTSGLAGFRASPLIVSTNYPDQMLPMVVRIHSAKSRAFDFALLLHFD